MGKSCGSPPAACPCLDEQGNFLGYRGANIDITERRKSQEALEIANTQLKALLEEADERNRNMALLNDMVDVLQSCRNSAEAFEAIGHFVPRFFPIDAGALYLLRDSKNLLSSVIVWGQPPPSEEMFPPEDCWAVRGGRVHRVDDPASALLCKHVPLTGTLATGYLCVPLMAQGTSLGIFHIRFLSCATQGREAGGLEAKQRLAVAIAENLSLALANLKLRESLQNQAIHDPLTGLYNRRYLEETMDRELHRARRQQTPLGVVMMDLDHFKDFNDTFGHAAGDALLSAVANVITDRHSSRRYCLPVWRGGIFAHHAGSLVGDHPGAGGKCAPGGEESPGEIPGSVAQIHHHLSGGGHLSGPRGSLPKRLSPPRTPPFTAPNKPAGIGSRSPASIPRRPRRPEGLAGLTPGACPRSPGPRAA